MNPDQNHAYRIYYEDDRYPSRPVKYVLIIAKTRDAAIRQFGFEFPYFHYHIVKVQE